MYAIRSYYGTSQLHIEFAAWHTVNLGLGDQSGKFYLIISFFSSQFFQFLIVFKSRFELRIKFIRPSPLEVQMSQIFNCEIILPAGDLSYNFV